MSPLATVVSMSRRRRAVLHRQQHARSNRALADAGRSLRAQAQAYLDAGRPDLAEPYLDEARLFEAAMQTTAGL